MKGAFIQELLKIMKFKNGCWSEFAAQIVTLITIASPPNNSGQPAKITADKTNGGQARPGLRLRFQPTGFTGM